MHIATYVDHPGHEAHSPAWDSNGRYLGEFTSSAEAHTAGARYWLKSPGLALDLDRPGFEVEDLRFRPKSRI